MGPALLPTPLSPTRGLLSCSALRLPGSANAWRPMFPRCPGRARLPSLHRRSHRHPIQLLVKNGPRAVFAMRQNRDQSIFPPDCRIDALISQGLGARPRCLAGLIGPLRFAFAVSSSGPFASGRSPLHLVLEVRADSNRSVFRLRIPLRNQAVEPSIVATSASFR